MNLSVWTLIISIGLFFSIAAAVMAGLITYSEYRHHYPGTREPKKHALESGVFAFLFFMVLSLVIGFIAVKLI